MTLPDGCRADRGKAPAGNGAVLRPDRVHRDLGTNGPGGRDRPSQQVLRGPRGCGRGMRRRRRQIHRRLRRVGVGHGRWRRRAFPRVSRRPHRRARSTSMRLLGPWRERPSTFAPSRRWPWGGAPSRCRCSSCLGSAAARPRSKRSYPRRWRTAPLRTPRTIGPLTRRAAASGDKRPWCSPGWPGSSTSPAR